MPEDRKVEKITCPYNVAHEIVPERFQGHLYKCREQYKVSDYVPCPYNAAHDVPVPELQYHKQTCSDRLKVDKVRFRIGEVQEDVAGPIQQIDLPEEDEDWDNPKATVSSYLQKKDDLLEQKPILRLVMGETKSQRKKFYNYEQMRFEEVGEGESEASWSQQRSRGRGVALDRRDHDRPRRDSDHSRRDSDHSRRDHRDHDHSRRDRDHDHSRRDKDHDHSRRDYDHPVGAGRGKKLKDPTDTGVGLGRGSSSRKPQTSVGESSRSEKIGSESLASLRRSLDEDRMSYSTEGSASKHSRIKEESVDSDSDDGFQIVVRSKGRGRGKKH